MRARPGAHSQGQRDAATRSLDAQQEALKLGCKAVYSSISEAAKHNLDVIVVFAGAGTTTADAIEAVRPGGRRASRSRAA